MARILTGIQSTGTPHLGNLLGAIIPAIKMSKDITNESLFLLQIFIHLLRLGTKKYLKKILMQQLLLG